MVCTISTFMHKQDEYLDSLKYYLVLRFLIFVKIGTQKNSLLNFVPASQSLVCTKIIMIDLKRYFGIFILFSFI